MSKKLQGGSFGIVQNNDDLKNMEDVPAYERKGILLYEAIPSSESEFSKYSLNEECNKDEEPKINLSGSNSFIHDNID